MNKYIDFIFSNYKTFYIIESSSKPKNSDAMTILAKIEFIVKNKLSYNSNHRDIYSNQSKSKLFKFLGAQSSLIHQRYRKKQSKLNYLEKSFFQ